MNFVDNSIILSRFSSLNLVDDVILSRQNVEHVGTIFCPVVLMKLDGRSTTMEYKILHVCEGKHNKRHQHNTKNSMEDINIVTVSHKLKCTIQGLVPRSTVDA